MPETRTEHQARLADFVLAYAQSRRADNPPEVALEVATTVCYGRALLREHDRSVLKLEPRP